MLIYFAVLQIVFSRMTHALHTKLQQWKAGDTIWFQETLDLHNSTSNIVTPMENMHDKKILNPTTQYMA